jgi:hypothetical protein
MKDDRVYVVKTEVGERSLKRLLDLIGDGEGGIVRQRLRGILSVNRGEPVIRSVKDSVRFFGTIYA